MQIALDYGHIWAARFCWILLLYRQALHTAVSDEIYNSTYVMLTSSDTSGPSGT